MWTVLRSNTSFAMGLARNQNVSINPVKFNFAKCSTHACNFRKTSPNTFGMEIARKNNLLSSSSFMPTMSVRWYAKRNKESGKKIKNQARKLDLNNPEINSIVNLDKFKERMEYFVNRFRKELAEQLTLRVTLDTVAAVKVEADDGETPLGDVAQLQQKTPQLIVVNVAQNPQLASKAKAAIIKSGINVTPQIDGSTLFLPIQKVTREHREKLAKSAKAICDRYKDKLRDTQNGSQKEVKNHKEDHSEDLIKDIQDHLLLQTKNYTSELEEILAAKQKEILNE